ncbi:MAG TPA: hypothetical protein VFD84_10895 [Candidatus Binatia bacterium]|nr:hypothetical protein [Candidatus Binatia bacterium]
METIQHVLTQPIEMPLWLLLAISLPIYVAFMWAISKVRVESREEIVCPRRDEPATVAFLRGPSGRREAVVSCSLLEDDGGDRCEAECVGQRA